MTDARMQDKWLYEPEFDILSDRAWRTMASSLMWSAGQGTDGALPATSLRFLHPLGVDEATAQELIDAGKWEKTPSGFQVLSWQKSQSLAADVEKQRERNRENVKNYRQRGKGGESPSDTGGDDTGDVSGDDSDYETDVVRGVPVGQDRQGQASSSELKLVPTGKPQTKMGAEPTRSIAASSTCPECKRRSAFDSGPCPTHEQGATA